MGREKRSVPPKCPLFRSRTPGNFVAPPSSQTLISKGVSFRRALYTGIIFQRACAGRICMWRILKQMEGWRAPTHDVALESRRASARLLLLVGPVRLESGGWAMSLCGDLFLVPPLSS